MANQQGASLIVLGAEAAGELSQRMLSMLRVGLSPYGIDVFLLSDNEAPPPTGNLLVLATSDCATALESFRSSIPHPLDLPFDDPTEEGYAWATLPRHEGKAALLLGASPRALMWAVQGFLQMVSRCHGQLGALHLSGSQAPFHKIRAEQTQLSFSDGGQIGFASAGAIEDRIAACKEEIDFAVQLRLNTIVIGSDWPAGCSCLVSYEHMPELADTVDADQVNARVRAFQEVGQYAVGAGMDAFLTLTEIYYPKELAERHPEALASPPPNGADRWYRPPASSFTSLASPHKLCPSHEVTRRFLRAKVRELAERLPFIAGLQIWVSHGTCDVFYCDCPKCHKLEPHERLLLLVNDALEALDQAGLSEAKIILRTYLGGWRQALAERFFLPLVDKLPPRVLIGTKAQYGDMYYGNAIHPLAGAFPNNDEIIEYCLAGEYRAGLGWGTTAPVFDDLAVRARRHARLGCSGIWMRHVSWKNRLNEVDFRVFGDLAWDPFSPVEPTVLQWARRRFGDRGPEVIGLFRGCTEVMSKALYARGVSLTHWAVFPENLQRLRHLTMDRSAQATEEGFLRLRPTEENLQLLLAEKDEAIARAGELLSALEDLRPDLSPKDYEALRCSLLIQQQLAHLFKGLVDCFWRYLIWERTLSEVEREWQRDELISALDGWKATIGKARAVLSEQYAPALFRALGTPETTWRAGFREEGYYLKHLDQIHQDIVDRISVKPASVWGYYPRRDR